MKVRFALSMVLALISACSSPPQLNGTGTWVDPVAQARPVRATDCPQDPLDTFEMTFSLTQRGQDLTGTVRFYKPGRPIVYGDVSSQVRNDGEVRGNITVYSQSGSPISLGFEGRLYVNAFAGRTVGPVSAICPSRNQPVDAYLQWNAAKR